MIQAKCIQKFRDKNNHIYGYRLIDINGQTQDVKPENLKKAIENRQVHVVNLTLTKDYRLIDTEEKVLQNKKVLGDAPVIKKSYVDKEEDWLYKISYLIFRELKCGEPKYCGCDDVHEFESNGLEEINIKSLAFVELDCVMDEYGNDWDDEIDSFVSDWPLTYIIYGNLKKKTISIYLGSRTFEMQKFRADIIINSENDIVKAVNASKELYKSYKEKDKIYKDNFTEEYFNKLKNRLDSRYKN